MIHRMTSTRTRTSTSSSSNSSMVADADADADVMLPSIQKTITTKLTQALEPTFLKVMNESHMHNVPKNSETHFKVVVVSSKFDSVKLPLERHRMINAILSQELTSKGGPVHALSIVAKSPSQWSKMMEENPTGDVVIESSPRCRGGDGSLPSSSSKR